MLALLHFGLLLDHFPLYFLFKIELNIQKAKERKEEYVKTVYRFKLYCFFFFVKIITFY